VRPSSSAPQPIRARLASRLLIVAIALSGCATGAEQTDVANKRHGAGEDASADVALDSDAATDASADGSNDATGDGGADSSTDVVSEVGVDAPIDAPIDVPIDAPAEASSGCASDADCDASQCETCQSGVCATACSGGTVCSSGACACPAGTRSCNGACIGSSTCCTDADCSGLDVCPGAGASCVCRTSPARIPIYRSYSGNGDHLLSVDPTEGPNAGYTDEGAIFYDYAEPCPAGTTPLDRLYGGGGEHFYTASQSEHDAYVSYGYSDEGAVGCVDTTQECGATALWRLVDPYLSWHFCTASQSEHDQYVSYGYTDDGIIGWVWPGP
jgi:hypothetical protein